MKNPLNNSGKIFRWYIWVPYSAAFVCTYTEQQYHQCETNTIDTWTQIQSISRYSDHGVRGTIDLSIFLGDQEPQPPVKSGHSSIWLMLVQRQTSSFQVFNRVGSGMLSFQFIFLSTTLFARLLLVISL